MSRVVTNPEALGLWDRFERAGEKKEKYAVLSKLAERMDDESLSRGARMDFAVLYLDAKHELEGPVVFDFGGSGS